MSALATGFALLPTAALMFAMIRLIPRLLARFGPKPVTVTGTVAMVTGLALLTRLSADSGYFPRCSPPWWRWAATAAREAGGSPTHALVGGMTAAFGAAACIAALTIVVALTFRSLRSAS
ncbi:hypothetical protein ACIGO9_33580 [Nocardia asteroides]|uniref:hypothetical protein n=1 Tax=Nocardia asteroides TaxID=1824 RepID=UPI0037C6480B